MFNRETNEVYLARQQVVLEDKAHQERWEGLASALFFGVDPIDQILLSHNATLKEGITLGDVKNAVLAGRTEGLGIFEKELNAIAQELQTILSI